jgi:hypothetical protein
MTFANGFWWRAQAVLSVQGCVMLESGMSTTGPAAAAAAGDGVGVFKSRRPLNAATPPAVELRDVLLLLLVLAAFLNRVMLASTLRWKLV